MTLTEQRAKYNNADLKKMAASGEAMPDGSYPIADGDDLDSAIHAVGRGGADHDTIRKHIAARAKALGMSHMIPDNWNADGSLTDADSAPLNLEFRRVYHDIREVRRSAEFELRAADANNLRFTGYASITESPYDRSDYYGDYQETIARGAFKRSLSEGADVAFLVNHNDLALPLARTKSGTMRLAEDSRGLHVEADFDQSSPAVAALRSAVERRDADEMSFAFRVPQGGQEWSKDYTQRRITDANLHRGDVSLVNAGSNPFTAGTVDLRSFAGALQELRAGKTLSTATMDTLKQVLSLVSAADDAVDAAQPLLADLMGVPNPDAGDENSGPDMGERSMSPAVARFLLDL